MAFLPGALDLDEAHRAFAAGDRQRVIEGRAGRAAARSRGSSG